MCALWLFFPALLPGRSGDKLPGQGTVSTGPPGTGVAYSRERVWEMSRFSWTLKSPGKTGESGIICPFHHRLGDCSGLLPYVLRAGSFL